MSNTILVTGANRGLGLAFCQHFLSQGDRVIACCRNVNTACQLKDLSVEAQQDLIILPLDVTDTQSIAMLKKSLEHQPIDMMINNAGIYQVNQLDYFKDAQYWQMMFATNTIGPYILAHALKPNLQLANQKKIINISSYMASIALNDNGMQPPYRASKAALNVLNKNLAVELRTDNIICVAIDPGWVRTDMGGPDGLLSAQESAESIVSTAANLTIDQTGQFLKYDGELMPW